MKLDMKLFLALSGVAAVSASSSSFWSNCKCTPNDDCWKKIDWQALNNTVAGKLIHNEPPAVSCYPGAEHNKDQCAYVNSQWSDTTFQSLQPVGYCYPVDDDCPVKDLSAGEIAWPGACHLGSSPVYSVNATEPKDLVAGIKFAKENNVRLVIRNTGHDILGKSTGYGSLQIWIKYLRQGIKYQDSYKPSASCSKSTWTGKAFTIAGGYVWDDVYHEAFPRNLVVVGGGDPTVGVIGGYIQGGGHSPAARDHGLATDQILEARVILADGSIVTANPCSHTDLFTAIRGGGGGTYGVVISVTIKAYASKPIVAHRLQIVPKQTLIATSLLDAVTDVYTAIPGLNDAGYSGYGSWSVSDPVDTYGASNKTSGYKHIFAAQGVSKAHAQAALAPLLTDLTRYGGLDVTVDWFEFASYGEYYRALSGVHQATGVPTFSLASRMFDKNALTNDWKALRKLVGTLAGNLLETTINQVIMVGGGKVLDAPEGSGANPAWRKTYLIHEVARGWLDWFGPLIAKGIKDDVTYTKYGAMRKFTPSMGSYLNEADRNNPWWKSDFYGTHYDMLLKIKNKYDPDDLFYCPTCVGSTAWTQRNLPGKDYGPICSTKYSSK